MPENHLLSFKTNIENVKCYFGGLVDLKCRTTEIEVSSCAIEKDNVIVSQVIRMHIKTRNVFKLMLRNKKQHCVAAAVDVVVS